MEPNTVKFESPKSEPMPDKVKDALGLIVFILFALLIHKLTGWFFSVVLVVLWVGVVKAYRALKKKIDPAPKWKRDLMMFGAALLMAPLVILTMVAGGFAYEHEQARPEKVAERAEKALQQAEKDRIAQEQAETDRKATEMAEQALASAKVKLREQTITELAPIYCKNHKNTEVSFTKNDNGWPTSSGNGFSAEECKTIITKLYDLNSNREQLDLVANRKVAVGMQSMFLIYSLGLPDEINSTYTGAGESQQRIYGSSIVNRMYVYTDESGVVTSIQN